MEDLIGKTIDVYEVIEKLGRGGMGEVYKARHIHLKTFHAIKRIAPSQAFLDLAQKEAFEQRFRREARAQAQLRHPHIVQLSDFRKTRYGFVIIMEWVQGEDWGQRLKRGRARPEEVKRLSLQLLEALMVTEAKGIIHRDIKPSNLLIDHHGNAKLVDFGLAKPMEASDESRVWQTADGQLAGSIYYMSPEQVQGHKVDIRSDLYSLGIVLFEALSGMPPTQRAGDDPQNIPFMIQKRIVDGTLPKLKDLAPQLPASLCDFVQKAIAVKPEKRFQSAASMRDALEKLDLGATHSDPYDWSQYWALIPIFLLTLGLGAWFIWQAWQETKLIEKLVVAEPPKPVTPEHTNNPPVQEVKHQSGDAGEVDGIEGVYIVENGETQFWMKHEVTQKDFAEFVTAVNLVTESEKRNGCKTLVGGELAIKTGLNWRNAHADPQTPVVCITWNEAKAYLQWKSKTQRWALPTVQHWKTALAGATVPAAGEAWTYENAKGKAQAVMTRKPNKYGLYDLQGNVWEWAEDAHEQDHHILGGSYLFERKAAMPDKNVFDDPSIPNANIGFRGILTL